MGLLIFHPAYKGCWPVISRNIKPVIEEQIYDPSPLLLYHSSLPCAQLRETRALCTSGAGSAEGYFASAYKNKFILVPAGNSEVKFESLKVKSMPLSSSLTSPLVSWGGKMPYYEASCWWTLAVSGRIESVVSPRNISELY